MLLFNSSCSGLQDQCFAFFKVKNTQLKDTGGKRKITRMLSFLSLDKGRLFFPKLSLKDETHEIFFMADWSVN